MSSRSRAVLGCLFTLWIAACGSSSGSFVSPPDVAGSFTIAVTNADNGCQLENWEPGKSTSDIPFLIEQDDSKLSGTLQGLAGLALAAGIGTNQFSGTASTSDDFQLTAYGTIPRKDGNCTYTLNAVVHGSVADDAISGTIEYAPATSDNPDCASVRCSSTQNFNGTRPPPAN